MIVLSHVIGTDVCVFVYIIYIIYRRKVWYSY
jgi:hypothetical protein